MSERDKKQEELNAEAEKKETPAKPPPSLEWLGGALPLQAIVQASTRLHGRLPPHPPMRDLNAGSPTPGSSSRDPPPGLTFAQYRERQWSLQAGSPTPGSASRDPPPETTTAVFGGVKAPPKHVAAAGTAARNAAKQGPVPPGAPPLPRGPPPTPKYNVGDVVTVAVSWNPNDYSLEELQKGWGVAKKAPPGYKAPPATLLAAETLQPTAAGNAPPSDGDDHSEPASSRTWVTALSSGEIVCSRDGSSGGSSAKDVCSFEVVSNESQLASPPSEWEFPRRSFFMSAACLAAGPSPPRYGRAAVAPNRTGSMTVPEAPRERAGRRGRSCPVPGVPPRLTWV